MSWKEVTVRLVTKPWVVASGAIATLLHVTGTAGLWEFVASLSSQWFGTLAIVSSFIAPTASWLPTDAVMGVVAAVAVIVFVAKADRTVEWMRDKYL